MRKIPVFLLGWFLFCGILFCVPVFAQFETHSNQLPAICFFPAQESFWDGYKVTDANWKLLSDEQKIRFIAEAIEEIKRKETLYVTIPNKEKLLLAMNAMSVQIEKKMPGVDVAMINILHDLLIDSGFFKEMT